MLAECQYFYVESNLPSCNGEPSVSTAFRKNINSGTWSGRGADARLLDDNGLLVGDGRVYDARFGVRVGVGHEGWRRNLGAKRLEPTSP